MRRSGSPRFGLCILWFGEGTVKGVAVIDGGNHWQMRRPELPEATERLREEMQQIVHVVSHDLRAPIRAIKGFAQLLEGRLAGQVDEQSARFLGRVIEAASAMNTQLDDLTAYSRIETKGKEPRRTDAYDVYLRSADALRGELAESGIDLVAERLPELWVDPEQLRLVFHHLIGNAIKYCGPGTKVRVTGDEDERFVTLRVVDDGPGIPASELEGVFAIFRRLHTSDEAPGNGIGLPMVRRIAERHGGEAWAQRSESGGTEICIRFAKAPG